MISFKKPWLSVLLLLTFIHAFGQDTFRLSSPVRDSLQFVEKEHPLNAGLLHSLILPAGLIAYGFIAAKTDPLLDLSESIKQEIWDDHPHPLAHVDNYLQYAPAVAVYALNLAGVKGEHNFVDRSIIFFMSNVIMECFVGSLKGLTHEMRPNGAGYMSFPSGHTAEAFLSASFLMKEYGSRSPWYGIAGYAVASSVGALRIYNNKHWLNDVVAGAGFGIASTEITYWLYPKLKTLFFPRAHSAKMIFPTYNQQAAGLAYIQYF